MISREHGRTKLIVLFCAIAFTLAVIAFLWARSYARLERFAGDLLSSYAPKGTTVGDIDLRFPTTIVLTNLVVPVQVDDRQRQLSIEKLSGKVSPLSLLVGKVRAEMRSDIFGGLLWLDVNADMRLKTLSAEPTSIDLETRARDLDLAQLCEFVQASTIISGKCSADVEAKLDESELTNLKGKALVLGEQIEIPRLDLRDVVLPHNSGVTLSSRLSARDGKVFLDKFQLEGTAYDLSGNGIVTLTDPVDLSKLDCSFTAIFKERPTIKNKDLARGGVDFIIDALISSRSEVSFRVGGTLRDPRPYVDSASSLTSILEQFRR